LIFAGFFNRIFFKNLCIRCKKILLNLYLSCPVSKRSYPLAEADQMQKNPAEPLFILPYIEKIISSG